MTTMATGTTMAIGDRRTNGWMDEKKFCGSVHLFNVFIPFVISLSLSHTLILCFAHLFVGAMAIGTRCPYTICACFAILFNVANAMAFMHDADIWVTVILVRLYFCSNFGVIFFFLSVFLLYPHSNHMLSSLYGMFENCLIPTAYGFLFAWPLLANFSFKEHFTIHFILLFFILAIEKKCFLWPSTRFDFNFDHWKMMLLCKKQVKDSGQTGKLFALQTMKSVQHPKSVLLTYFSKCNFRIYIEKIAM